MRRWFHNRFNRHRWTEVTHQHDVLIEGETCHYSIVECSCGLLEEIVQVHHELPSPFPGITAGYIEVKVSGLARLEDAKVWVEQ